MTRYRWNLATLLAAVVMLGCDSQPGGPDSGIPSYAKHPTLTIDDSVALSGQPFAAAVSPFGVVYVTRLSADSVARAVLPSQSFGTQFGIGDLPSQVRISPNGQTAFVSNQGTGGGSGTSFVKFVRVSDNVVFDTVTVPGSVLTIGISPNGTRLYALTDFRGVYILDAINGTLLDSISPANTDSLLTGVAFHPYMLRMYIAARDKGKVTTINTQTNAVVSTISIGSGGRLQNVAVSRDGTKLFGTDIQRSKLITWNLVSGTPVASPSETTVGTGGTNNNAFDVAVTPDNVHIYVTTLVDHKLFVFDQSLAAVTNIITSGKPRYIAFDYPGETAVIPNENGWVDFIK